jgi:hypothetical protein
MGFGIAFPLPINDMLTIHLYHNAILFNVINNGGDIARANLFEIDIGFF